MEIKIVKDKISFDEIKKIAKETFGEMVKAVVDIEKEIMAVGGELHADTEALLVEDGSKNNNLWGINIYINKPKDQMVEFSALINIKPALGNRAMEVQNLEIKEKIEQIIDKLIV